jgi:hypothetical protein
MTIAYPWGLVDRIRVKEEIRREDQSLLERMRVAFDRLHAAQESWLQAEQERQERSDRELSQARSQYNVLEDDLIEQHDSGCHEAEWSNISAALDDYRETIAGDWFVPYTRHNPIPRTRWPQLADWPVNHYLSNRVREAKGRE